MPSYESVTDYDAAGRLIQTAIDEYGTIDILVNNAGIVRDRSLLKMTAEDFDAVVKVHMYGTFNTAQHAAGAHEGSGLRADHQRHVPGRAAGQLRPDQLRRGQGRDHGHDVHLVARARPLRHHGQRDVARRRHPHDRRRCSSGPAPSRRPESNPALNAPLVTWVASEHAAHVNGQILGRTDFAYTIYQHPKQVAYMYREGGFDVAGVDENFDKILGQHLQHVGMAMPGGMEHKK